MSCPPRRCCAEIHCMIGGIVSAQFEPQSSSALVSAMSLDRKGQAAIDAERAVLAGRRRGHAVAAVVVDVRRAAARRARTCPAGRPSRWSARRCRTPPAPAAPCASRSAEQPLGDEVERRVPASPARAARRRRARAACVDALGWSSSAAGGEALDAHLAAVDRERLVGAGPPAPPAVDGHPALERAVRAVGSDRECGE